MAFFSRRTTRLILAAAWILAAAGPASGAVRFVDARAGDDAGDGTIERPWRSLGFALTQLAAGDSLHLRGGVYYETVRCSLVGAPGKPITIRSQPGERAILDGGYREFFETPATAWTPAEPGMPGEFHSTRAYRNVTGVAGAFGDGSVGLLSYWLAEDLRATNETWRLHPEKKILTEQVYAGPGLWYEAATGFVHCRLAHTHNNHPRETDYRGETDPRRLPLVIAPLHAVPLRIEQAQHVRFQDLTLRGAGRQAVIIERSRHVTLDNLTVQCGGIDGRNSGHVKIIHSTVTGRIPPWLWRIDSSKGCASGSSRDLAMLLTDVLLETSHNTGGPAAPRRVVAADDADGTPQMVGWPGNHDWEVAHCEFTDGHDGVFWVGANMRFHHNRVENMQDDAIDISGPESNPRDTLFIYQNVFRRFVSGLSTHNYYNGGGPRGQAWVFRNVFDMSEGVRWIRPSDKAPRGELRCGRVFNIHGADSLPHLESIYLYQNTIIGQTGHPYGFAHDFLGGTRPGSERRIFNNLFVYLDEKGRYPVPFHGVNTTNANLQVDGNLHWNPQPAAVAPTNYLAKLREHPLAQLNDGVFGANDRVGDPRLDATGWSIGPGSAAIGAGVSLPAAWEDPLRPAGGKRPDSGALPAGLKPWPVGRERITGERTDHGGIGTPSPVAQTSSLSVSLGIVTLRDDFPRMWMGDVAQVSNLPYRGFPIRDRLGPSTRCRLEVGDTAGWKPALLWLRLRRAALYRGFPIRGRCELATLCRLEVGDTAGWKPALPAGVRQLWMRWHIAPQYNRSPGEPTP